MVMLKQRERILAAERFGASGGARPSKRMDEALS
jgi:hypothetical protein